MATHKEIIELIKPVYEDDEKMIVSYEDYAYLERTEGDHHPTKGTLLWRGKEVYRNNEVR